MTSAMDAITAEAAAHLAVLERLHRELTSLTVTARADEGRVVVQLDCAGALAGLQLRPGAGRGDAAVLSQLIVEAAAAAARELCTRRADLTAEFLEEFDDTPGGQGTEEASGASNL
ncbi:YbaB/EbfC family nucleoid-associated protein [Gordonia hirsuta]|nr:YbaB/EbfC family nucleoid-associated protein [Gordonia hirsuta]